MKKKKKVKQSRTPGCADGIGKSEIVALGFAKSGARVETLVFQFGRATIFYGQRKEMSTSEFRTSEL